MRSNILSRRLLVSLTATIPLAGLVAACSTTSSDDGDDSGGGSFTVASPYPIESLDPHGSAGASIGSQLADQAIFSRLVKADTEGQITADLATDWQPNDDATSWTFTLRDGVRFSDGSDLTVDDVVASFERFVDGENPNAGSFTEVTAEADGDNAVVFTSGVPDPALPGKLTLFFVTPAEVGDDFFSDPVGTGPFVMESFTPGEELNLTPNENHYDGQPDLDRVTVRDIPEVSSRMTALSNNEIQATWGVPDDQLASLSGNDDINVESVPSTSVYTMWFNSSRPALADAEVRRAIWQAVDFETIVSELHPQTGALSDSVLAPSVFGYSPQSPIEYNPDAAQQALENAGFDFSQTLELQFRGAEYRQFADAVVADLAEIDVSVDPVEKEDAVFLEDLLALEWDINFQSLSTPTFDAATNLGRLYPCEANRNGYCNSELDQILADAGATGDEAQRQQLYDQASQIIWDDAVGMYPMQVNIAYAWRSSVQGLEHSPSYLPDLSKVTVSS